MNIPPAGSLKYTDEEIRKASKKPQLPFGWHFMKFTNAKHAISESEKMNGTMQISAQCAALSDPQDANSTVRPFMYNSLWIPFDNPDMPGHTVPGWVGGMAARFLRSCFDDENDEYYCPMPPIRDKDTGELMYKGEVIDDADEDEMRDDAMRHVYEVCRALWEDPSILIDRCFYGKVDQDKSKRYVNVVVMENELPEGEQLVDLNAVDEPPPKEARAKKKAKKKAARK